MTPWRRHGPLELPPELRPWLVRRRGQALEGASPRDALGHRARRLHRLAMAQVLGGPGDWEGAWARAWAPSLAPGPWPVRALVADAALAMGLAPGAGAGLLAAAGAWHLAGAALDDAMDGEALEGGPSHAPWARVACEALASMQLAPRLAVAHAKPGQGLAVAQALARSGRRLAAGQRQDVAGQRAWEELVEGGGPALAAWVGQPGGPAGAWARAARGKTGGAMALHASLVAWAAGAPSELAWGLEALGLALGEAWQLSSEADDPPGSPPGLAAWLAWQGASPGDRQEVGRAWAGRPGALPWPMVLSATGVPSAWRAHELSAWARAEGLAQALARGPHGRRWGPLAKAWVAEGRAASPGRLAVQAPSPGGFF